VRCTSPELEHLTADNASVATTAVLTATGVSTIIIDTRSGDTLLRLLCEGTISTAAKSTAVETAVHAAAITAAVEAAGG